MQKFYQIEDSVTKTISLENINLLLQNRHDYKNFTIGIIDSHNQYCCILSKGIEIPYVTVRHNLYQKYLNPNPSVLLNLVPWSYEDDNLRKTTNYRIDIYTNPHTLSFYLEELHVKLVL